MHWRTWRMGGSGPIGSRGVVWTGASLRCHEEFMVAADIVISSCSTAAGLGSTARLVSQKPRRMKAWPKRRAAYLVGLEIINV